MNRYAKIPNGPATTVCLSIQSVISLVHRLAAVHDVASSASTVRMRISRKMLQSSHGQYVYDCCWCCSGCCCCCCGCLHSLHVSDSVLKCGVHHHVVAAIDSHKKQRKSSQSLSLRKFVCFITIFFCFLSEFNPIWRKFTSLYNNLHFVSVFDQLRGIVAFHQNSANSKSKLIHILSFVETIKRINSKFHRVNTIHHSFMTRCQRPDARISHSYTALLNRITERWVVIEHKTGGRHKIAINQFKKYK